MATCAKYTKWGKCKQPQSQAPSGYCVSHERWKWLSLNGTEPEPFYEEKIVKGLLQPLDAYLTEPEIAATVGGRYRGDGRRIDQYTLDDPIAWTPRSATMPNSANSEGNQ